MATSPIPLDRTPPPPSQVTNQTGAGAQAGPNPAAAGLMQRIAQAIQQRQQAQQSGAAPGGAPTSPAQNLAAASPMAAANPNAQLISQADQIEQLASGIARANDKFGPWASRIVSLLRAGMGEVLSSPPPGAPSQAPTSAEAAGASSAVVGNTKPPDGGPNSNFAG